MDESDWLIQTVTVHLLVVLWQKLYPKFKKTRKSMSFVTMMSCGFHGQTLPLASFLRLIELMHKCWKLIWCYPSASNFQGNVMHDHFIFVGARLDTHFEK
jgi:hypothetical protein